MRGVQRGCPLEDVNDQWEKLLTEMKVCPLSGLGELQREFKVSKSKPKRPRGC